MDISSWVSGSPQTAQVRILGESEYEFMAEILQSDSRTITIRCDQALPYGVAVRMDLNDGMILGETGHNSLSSGVVTTVIEIDQVIPSMSQVAHLMQGILGTYGGSASRSNRD